MKSMKTILSTLILTLVFMSGNAQRTISKQNEKAQDVTVYNYVVLTKKVDQLTPILMAAEALLKENKDEFGSFEIIICGKDIGEITNREKMDGFIDKAKSLNANIIACGFSLKKFDVDQNKIPEDIKIIDNGIQFNMELQKKGYLSLEL
jgi:intracellular sulfur oxidation DsrE/DsrF family protein